MQKGQLVAFESRKLTNTKKNLSVYDKEMLAIMHALEKFKQYLVCGLFIIRSDHNSLKYFLSQTDLTEKQQRWVIKLQSYDFEIQYIKGKKNAATDALSKNPLFYSLSTIGVEWKREVMDEYSQEEFTTGILNSQSGTCGMWSRRG